MKILLCYYDMYKFNVNGFLNDLLLYCFIVCCWLKNKIF